MAETNARNLPKQTTETKLVRISTKHLSFLAFLSFLSTGMAQAQESHVTITAITDFDAYIPGDSGLLAITLKVDEDWHTYWPGVSDSGFGINLDIKANEDITLDDPIWPTPKRYLQPGEILDHIYEETTIVLVPFHVDEDATLDQAVGFEIDASFLVCKDICLPGDAQASTTTAIITDEEQKQPATQHDQIHKLFKARPSEFDEHAASVRLQWIAKAAAVMVQGARRIEFFPSKECTTLADPIKGGLTDSDRLIIEFDTAENKVLSGRIRAYTHTGIIDYDINVKPSN